MYQGCKKSSQLGVHCVSNKEKVSGGSFGVRSGGNGLFWEFFFTTGGGFGIIGERFLYHR